MWNRETQNSEEVCFRIAWRKSVAILIHTFSYVFFQRLFHSSHDVFRRQRIQQLRFRLEYRYALTYDIQSGR
jgi:hypothetical protein